MIGALDYDESLSQTLKNNGIGIIVSTLTGIKGSKELFKNEFPKTLMPSVLKNDNSREVLLEGGIKASELNETAPFAKGWMNAMMPVIILMFPKLNRILKI